MIHAHRCNDKGSVAKQTELNSDCGEKKNKKKKRKNTKPENDNNGTIRGSNP